MECCTVSKGSITEFSQEPSFYLRVNDVIACLSCMLLLPMTNRSLGSCDNIKSWFPGPFHHSSWTLHSLPFVDGYTPLLLRAPLAASISLTLNQDSPNPSVT